MFNEPEIFHIELKGVKAEEVQRYTKLIHLIISSNGLDVKNGETILHWEDNYLQDVEIRFHPYTAKNN